VQEARKRAQGRPKPHQYVSTQLNKETQPENKNKQGDQKNTNQTTTNIPSAM
jgi:hypothetical protein